MPCRKGIAARKKAGIFRDIIADWQLGSILEAEISCNSYLWGSLGFIIFVPSSWFINCWMESRKSSNSIKLLDCCPLQAFFEGLVEGSLQCQQCRRQCCLYLEIAYDFGLKYHEKRGKKHEISISELRVFTSKACWYLVHSCAAWQVRNCTWSSQRGVHRRQQTAGAFAAKLAVFEASALPWVVHPSEQCKPQIALSNHWRSCAYYCLLDLCLHKTAKTPQLASTGDAGKNTCGLWESTNKYSHDHNTARNSGTRVRIPAGLLELGKACHLHCCHIQVGPIKLKLSNL